MSGGPTLLPTLTEIRTLLDASRTMGGPVGSAVELAILTLALPFEVVAMRIEGINVTRRFVEVPTRRHFKRRVALSQTAMRAIVRITGSISGSGQIVTAGRGTPLTTAQLRLDRLVDRFADEAPDTGRIGAWNFHGIRQGAAKSLLERGADRVHIDALLGRQRREDVGRFRDHGEAAMATAERWAAILLDDRSRKPRPT